MGQDAVNGILEGLKIAQGRRAQNLQNQIEQQRLQQSDQQHKDEVDLKTQELKQRANEFDVTTKAAQAMHKLQLLQEEQRISGNLENGMSIPGATSAPGADTNHLTYTVPGIDQPLTVRTPTFVNQQLGERKAAEEGPAQQAAINLQAAKQKELDTRQAEAEKARQDREVQLQKQRDDAALLRTKTTAGARITAAQISAAKKKDDPTLENFDPIPHIGNVLGGGMTLDDAKKLGKGQAAAIEQGVSEGGGSFVNPDQKKFIENFGPALEVIPKIKDLNDLIAQHSLETQLPGGQHANMANTLSDQIHSGLISASSGPLGQSARALGTAIKTDMNAFTPQKGFYVGESNKQKVNAYVKLLNDTVDQKLSNLPKGQVQHIKEQMGLDKYLTPDNASGSAPAAPSVPQAGQTFNGEKVLKVTKIQ